MRSATPKHLHPVAGIPIVERVIRAGLAIGPYQLVAVVSQPLRELPAILHMEGQFETAVQQTADGTAAAVRCAMDVMAPCDWIVSLLGDSPLLTQEVLRSLVDAAISNKARLAILTCVLPKGGSYGRIDRNVDGNICRIVEAKNDDPARRADPTEINSGITIMEAAWAREALSRVERNPETQEFMLTDLVEQAASEVKPGEPWPIISVEAGVEVALGVNDRRQQAEADAFVRANVRERLLANGVTIIGGQTVFIDESVTIGPDTTVLPGCMITGATAIGTGCQIGPDAILHNARIGDGVRVVNSTVTDSQLQDRSDVGPYAHIRGGSRIGQGVHIGTSSEIKNTSMGAGSKCGHFSYLGDATIGERVNIGAGTITANYDGTRKHPTEIEDDAFIGSDSVLVAPVRIGSEAITGAGSVVTRDVEEATVVVGVPARAIRRVSLESQDSSPGPHASATEE
jgi:bifunctional UDP-N-acetylglucosamine pyrophosphorylase/glucosamine-1-phosphate N-acetyltransferase